MEKYSHYRQMLIVTFISLFLLTNIMPMTNSLRVSEIKTVETKSSSDLIHVSGTMGQNGWYVSNVQITIHPPQGAGPVYYSFDNMTWQDYMGLPIIIDLEGVVTFYCFYMMDGNQSEVYSVIFKIDQTPPYVNVTFYRQGCNVLVSVNALDNLSGVVLVEFYSDGSLIGSVTIEPWDFQLHIGLFGEHTVEVFVYDEAGNSASASHTFPYGLGRSQNILYQQMFHLFQNLIENTIYRLFI